MSNCVVENSKLRVLIEFSNIIILILLNIVQILSYLFCKLLKFRSENFKFVRMNKEVDGNINKTNMYRC